MLDVEPAVPPFCCSFSYLVSSGFSVDFLSHLLLKEVTEASAVGEPQWLNQSSSGSGLASLFKTRLPDHQGKCFGVFSGLATSTV